MKQFTVAIVGLGSRGLNTYGRFERICPERMRVVAIADIDPLKRSAAAEEFGLREDMCFADAESLFAVPKLADVVIIATQDTQHCAHALAALEKGYDILLEKPISNRLEDCISIRDRAKQMGKTVTVCHVLRYCMFFKTIKSVLQSGVVGEPVAISAVENVGYWHQAHSFVRGNWRNDKLESPMIVQKCCHDFDIFNWLLERKCLSLNSYGSLKYFKKENAPEGSAEFCHDCAARENCAYDAYKIYGDRLAAGHADWPVDVLLRNPTPESLCEYLKNGQYGRCVFRCDNNVVDHQSVSLLYEDGITVSFTMCAFSEGMSRQIKLMCTRGEIIGDQVSNKVTVNVFGGESIEYDISTLTDDLSGHGGGDNQMVREMFDVLEGGGVPSSSIERSVHSHVIAFAAEYSRLNQGKSVSIDEFERGRQL